MKRRQAGKALSRLSLRFRWIRVSPVLMVLAWHPSGRPCARARCRRQSGGTSRDRCGRSGGRARVSVCVLFRRLVPDRPGDSSGTSRARVRGRRTRHRARSFVVLLAERVRSTAAAPRGVGGATRRRRLPFSRHTPGVQMAGRASGGVRLHDPSLGSVRATTRWLCVVLAVLHRRRRGAPIHPPPRSHPVNAAPASIPRPLARDRKAHRKSASI